MASGGLFGGGREKKRFLFIICVNNDEIFSECQFYIDKLKVPPGYSKSVRVIRDARGMCQAYNSAMTEEPAKYRIYMHQDVSILNPYFLYDILEIFESDKKIGMIGMVGSKKLPPDAVVWHGERVGNLYSLDPDNVDFENYRYSVDEGLTDGITTTCPKVRNSVRRDTEWWYPFSANPGVRMMKVLITGGISMPTERSL